MFVVRNVFKTKPGRTKALVEAFKKAVPHLEKDGVAKNTRVMTDTAAGFWTVIVESEVEDLNAYLGMAKSMAHIPEVAELAVAYNEFSHEGYREIFKIE